MKFSPLEVENGTDGSRGRHTTNYCLRHGSVQYVGCLDNLYT